MIRVIIPVLIGVFMATAAVAETDSYPGGDPSAAPTVPDAASYSVAPSRTTPACRSSASTSSARRPSGGASQRRSSIFTATRPTRHFRRSVCLWEDA